MTKVLTQAACQGCGFGDEGGSAWESDRSGGGVARSALGRRGRVADGSTGCRSIVSSSR
jgi:hypothetical protein